MLHRRIIFNASGNLTTNFVWVSPVLWAQMIEIPYDNLTVLCLRRGAEEDAISERMQQTVAPEKVINMCFVCKTIFKKQF